MARDPFARLPVPTRLWAAALLTLVPLGLTWTKVHGYLTNGVFGPMQCDSDGGDCTPGIYTAGVYVPGATTHVSQSPARLFLVAAAAALVLTATRVRTAATLRIARLATGSLAIAAVLAAGHRATATLVCIAAALALVVPVVWTSGVARAPVPGRRR